LNESTKDFLQGNIPKKKKEYKGKHVINTFLMDKYMDD
jgi:hypothetical protein